jgi:hypothetical protein
MKTVLNLTNILRAAFAPILLRQDSTNLKCKFKKDAGKTFVWKSSAKNVGEIDYISFI